MEQISEKYLHGPPEWTWGVIKSNDFIADE
jgi:hypothetical protein